MQKSFGSSTSCIQKWKAGDKVSTGSDCNGILADEDSSSEHKRSSAICHTFTKGAVHTNFVCLTNFSPCQSVEYRAAPPPGSRSCLNRLDTPQKWVKKCGSHLESHGSSHIIWWLTMRNRIVFNCSYTHQANNCNELILPGPNLSSSLLGVLLWFREHSTAVGSDIKGMFHQATPEDRPLLRFLSRDMQRDNPPSVYKWQILPFGTTCSPCCAKYALQRHVTDYSQEGDDAFERHFYVDNWLQSFSSPKSAKATVNKVKDLRASGGFKLRQWASKILDFIRHLPPEILSQDSDHWLNQSQMDQQVPALDYAGGVGQIPLTYKSHLQEASPTTMRNIYRVLASQYVPLGFIPPFTTRAKILVQLLWNKRMGWPTAPWCYSWSLEKRTPTSGKTLFDSLLCKPQTRPPRLQQWSPHLLWRFRAGLKVCCISAGWRSTRPSWGGIHYCPIASSSQETTFKAQAGAVCRPHWCSTCPSVAEGTNSEHCLDYPVDRLNDCS